jgi:hypothetical protein
MSSLSPRRLVILSPFAHPPPIVYAIRHIERAAFAFYLLLFTFTPEEQQ